MRVDLFEVRLNNSNFIYIAGQTVTGSVVIRLSKATWIDTINIKFCGRAKSRWDVSYGDSSKRYQADEVYIDSEYCLYQSENRVDKHPIGTHVYPFDFMLPPDVPSSFEGRRGYVNYECLVTMDLGWKGMMEREQQLTVIRHLDLATLPHAAMPQNLQEEEMYEGCCCDSGTVSATLRLQKSGFVPGEPMQYDIRVNNQATSTIYGVSLFLVQLVQYTGFSDSVFSSGNPKYHNKVNEWDLFHSDDKIGAGKAAIFRSHCIIPAVAPSLLEGCNIIDITYEIHLKVPVGWRTIHINCGVFIGTVPLRLPEPTGPSDVDTNHSSFDLDISSSPPVRPQFELPPSYEECVFGRMESQEGTEEDDIDEGGRANVDSGGGPSTAASRRSRFHRLPSYPYYNSEHFTDTGAYITAPPPPHGNETPVAFVHSSGQTNTYPLPPPSPPQSPPPPALPTGYSPLSQSEGEALSSLPPPPSYESLHQ
ncbi:arrestin domain-containing protein 17 [Aplysia californica]|uniref:Arrestin domain-containing protein 17 n=1 Tax=Aplysia californica TaxID=6500 RepID=A0ABM0JLZ8_APLCA|nr:arrestin domain-containing protein 17 [Aplysia californica]